MKHGKKYNNSASLVERAKQYDPADAMVLPSFRSFVLAYSIIVPFLAAFAAPNGQQIHYRAASFRQKAQNVPKMRVIFHFPGFHRRPGVL